jgi:hypothetical protein
MKWQKLTHKTKLPLDKYLVIYTCNKQEKESILDNVKNEISFCIYENKSKKYKLVQFDYKETFMISLLSEDELKESCEEWKPRYFQIIENLPVCEYFNYDFNHSEDCSDDCDCKNNTEGFEPGTKWNPSINPKNQGLQSYCSTGLCKCEKCLKKE